MFGRNLCFLRGLLFEFIHPGETGWIHDRLAVLEAGAPARANFGRGAKV
jgi:hypothetical protein